MSISLVTYANQTVTPMNDAIIYEKAIDQNGIMYGAEISVSANTITIGGGYGMICGREFLIESETISITLASSSTELGRLYVRLDLADTDAPIQLLTATGSTLPSLTQEENANYTNGVWEMELATFNVGVSELSDLVTTYDSVVGTQTLISEYAGGVDYITETGTTDGYFYRKWNSGKVEAWGLITFADVATNTSAFNGYRSADITFTLPAVMTTCEEAFANVSHIDGNGFGMIIRVKPADAVITFLRSNNTTNNWYVNMYLVGV